MRVKTPAKTPAWEQKLHENEALLERTADRSDALQRTALATSVPILDRLGRLMKPLYDEFGKTAEGHQLIEDVARSIGLLVHDALCVGKRL